jgi:hypothetical protein
MLGILQGPDIVKLIKLLRLRWYGHITKLNSESMPKKSDCRNGIRKRGRLWKALTDEVGEVVKILGIRN